MLRRGVRCALAVFVVLGSLMLGVGSLDADDESGAGGVSVQSADFLRKCIAQKRSLSVAWLIDQSRSLIKNDGFSLRYIPLSSTVQVIGALLDQGIDTGAENQLKIQASVLGFGDGMVVRQDWTSLTTGNIEDFRQTVIEQSRRADDSYTQYNRALEATLQHFEDPATADSCRLVFWFSDGEHDYDDSEEITRQERGQILKMCEAGGIADQLRTTGTQLWAVGLNSDPRELELMHLIAENAGEFVGPDISLSSGQCGSFGAIGSYVIGSDAASLGSILDGLPGIPDDPVETANCGQANCAEISFTADASITGFRMRLSRPAKDTAVELVLPDGETISILSSREGEDLTRPESLEEEANERDRRLPSSLRIVDVSEREVLVVARRSGQSELAGLWTVRFLGEGATEAEGRVSFEGLVSIRLEDENGNELKEVDRFEPRPVVLKILGADGVTPVPPTELKVEARAVGAMRSIDPPSQSVGLFTISAATLAEILQSDDFADALAVDLLVEPEAVVVGLTTADGKSIPIDFGVATSRFGVTNGAAYPTFIPSQNGVEYSLKDRGEFAATFDFRGPDAVDGVVRLLGFKEEFENQKEFKVTGSDECSIPRQQIVSCTFTFKPGKNGYGLEALPLIMELNSPEAAEPLAQTAELKVFMTRSPNVGKGIRNAILLVSGFLLLNLLIRYTSALLIGRFEPLSPTSRRVRIPVKVNAAGELSAPSGGQFEIPVPGSADNNFAIEISEPQRDFNLFGYNFHISPMKLLFSRMTRVPVGSVSREDHFVFGSSDIGALARRTWKRTARSTGGVALSLRGQWIIGIPKNGLRQLTADSSEVDAEFVAILDPYEITPADSQVAELITSVVVGSFSSRLKALIDEERTRSEEKVDTESSVTGVEKVNTAPSSVVDPISPFEMWTGDVDGASGTQSEVPRQKPDRRKRKKENSSDQPTEDSGIASSPDDPFAAF